jgi:hypothetical protein
MRRLLKSQDSKINSLNGKKKIQVLPIQTFKDKSMKPMPRRDKWRPQYHHLRRLGTTRKLLLNKPEMPTMKERDNLKMIKKARSSVQLLTLFMVPQPLMKMKLLKVWLMK